MFLFFCEQRKNVSPSTHIMRKVDMPVVWRRCDVSIIFWVIVSHPFLFVLYLLSG